MYKWFLCCSVNSLIEKCITIWIIPLIDGYTCCLLIFPTNLLRGISRYAAFVLPIQFQEAPFTQTTA